MKNSIKDFFENKTTRVEDNANRVSKEKMKKVNIFDKFNVWKINNKEGKKLNTEKIKEFALIFSAVVLIGVGYVNFSSNSKGMTNEVVETVAKSTNSIGDVELVSSEAVLVDNQDITNSSEIAKGDGKNDSDNSNIVDNQVVPTNNNEEVAANSNNLEDNTKIQNPSNENQTYFTELKLNREDMYSKNLETYQKVVDSSYISNEQKAIAIQEIENLTKEKNAIGVAEELIKLKGFEDVVIYKNNDSITVIVRIAALSNEQVAQIQNIVSRELSCNVSNINISNK